MTTIAPSSNAGNSANIGGSFQALESFSARVDVLEKRINARDKFFNSTLVQGIVLVGKVSAAIAAAVGISVGIVYLTTAIYHSMMGSAIHPIVEGIAAVVGAVTGGIIGGMMPGFGA